MGKWCIFAAKLVQLESRLLDAQMELDSKEECETNEDVLVKILKFSHEQVMAGKTYSQEEAERFLDQRLYEFTI